MDHYAGIDVSLEYSSVCVVDVGGKIVREGNLASGTTQKGLTNRGPLQKDGLNKVKPIIGPGRLHDGFR